MDVKDFLQTGVIEMYCMGIVSEQEKQLVKDFSELYPEVQKEIETVSKALQNYASAEGKRPQASLKAKIMNRILAESQAVQLPPKLKDKAKVNFWLDYLLKNKKAAPENFEDLFSLDLPSDEKQVTYAVWAKKGAEVEESHESEDEYLFMLRGSCLVTLDGVEQLYKSGDLVYIPKNVVHKAVAFSNDMLLIGQRIAA